MSALPVKIAEVNVATATMDLPQPLHLGAMTVHRREYAGVEIVTSDGYRGKAYCLTRETPMAEIVSRLFSPALVQTTLEHPASHWESLYRRSAIVGRVGLVRRALGLVDIALWDIASQRAGLALQDYLSQSPAFVVAKDSLASDKLRHSSLIVAAYPTAGKSAREIADEVLTHARQGWSLLKIARTPDRDLMRELLRLLCAELPDGCEVVVDVGFGWRDAQEALDELSDWGEVSLAWLEDPLLPEDVDGIAAIRRHSGLRIGVGDEVTDPSVLRSLVEAKAIDVLRLDVVAIGGITPSLDVINWAYGQGVPISGHVYPEVTVHLGIGVETFPRYEGPYDPSPAFIIGGPSFTDGFAEAPREPGLGFILDPSLFRFGKENS